MHSNFTGYLSSYKNLTVDYYTEKYVLFVTYTILPLVASLSCIFNLTIFVLVLHLKINNRVYNYIIIKSFFKACISAFLIYMENAGCMYCESNFYHTKFKLMYKTYIIAVTVDSLSVMIGLTETFITFDRLCMLKNTKNWITRLTQKYVVIGIISLSIILHIPECFVYEFEHVTEEINKRQRTKFADTNFYKIYYLGFLNIFKFSLLIFYLVLVVLVVINYRKFLAKKARLRSARVSENARHENETTKMIISIGVCYSFATTFIVVSNVLGRLEELTKTYNSTFIIIKNTGYIITFANLCFGGMSLLFYDSHMKKTLRKFIRCKQIS